MISLSEFTKQRNEALLSLCANKIWRIFKIDGKKPPETKREFWLSVHKARLLISSMPSHAKTYSKNWLLENESEHFDEKEMAQWL